MKDKIFAKLKQAYSPLGLGDAILLGHAEALAALGFVTDDNVDAAVAAQKSFLEKLQKSADTRVQDAVAKAKAKAAEDAETARKAAGEALDKAVREAAEKAKAEALAEAEARRKKPGDPDDGDLPDWFLKQRESFETKAREMRQARDKQDDTIRAEIAKFQKAQKEQQDLIAALTRENESIKAERAKAERMGFITSKAKEMGIPQYRIDEGFAGLGEASTDDEVVAALSTVARNIKANQLPELGSRFALGGGEPSKSELDALAKSIIK